jgi:hypothetical protein
MGDFAERIDELADLVGRGPLVGTVNVDQVYAAVQHEGYWVSGPLAGHHIHRGRLKYLEGPLLGHASQYMGEIADRLLSEGPDDAMIDNVKNLVTQVLVNAPVELDNLRRSASGRVTSDGDTIFDQPAEVPRLSREELRAERAGRGKSSRWRGV